MTKQISATDFIDALLAAGAVWPGEKNRVEPLATRPPLPNAAGLVKVCVIVGEAVPPKRTAGVR